MTIQGSIPQGSSIPNGSMQGLSASSQTQRTSSSPGLSSISQQSPSRTLPSPSTSATTASKSFGALGSGMAATQSQPGAGSSPVNNAANAYKSTWSEWDSGKGASEGEKKSGFFSKCFSFLKCITCFVAAKGAAVLGGVALAVLSVPITIRAGFKALTADSGKGGAAFKQAMSEGVDLCLGPSNRLSELAGKFATETGGKTFGKFVEGLSKVLDRGIFGLAAIGTTVKLAPVIAGGAGGAAAATAAAAAVTSESIAAAAGYVAGGVLGAVGLALKFAGGGGGGSIGSIGRAVGTAAHGAAPAARIAREVGIGVARGLASAPPITTIQVAPKSKKSENQQQVLSRPTQPTQVPPQPTSVQKKAKSANPEKPPTPIKSQKEINADLIKAKSIQAGLQSFGFAPPERPPVPKKPKSSNPGGQPAPIKSQEEINADLIEAQKRQAKIIQQGLQGMFLSTREPPTTS